MTGEIPDRLRSALRLHLEEKTKRLEVAVGQGYGVDREAADQSAISDHLFQDLEHGTVRIGGSQLFHVLGNRRLLHLT